MRSCYVSDLASLASERTAMKTKQELLDQIEQSALIIGGEIVLAKSGLVRARIDIIEEHLENIIDATLELKKLEGVPSNLKKVEKS